MKQTKQIINLIETMLIEKSAEATILKHKYPEPENKKYYMGKICAFDEIYKFIENLKKHIK